MIRLAALLCLIALAPLAGAQQAEPAAAPTPRQGMARVMFEAMIPTTQVKYGRDWDAMSIRVSRHMHWHLAPPDQTADPTSSVGIRRNGWIEDGFAQIGVSAYGRDSVDSLTFALSPTMLSSQPDADDDVIAALTAIGVTATSTPSQPSFSAISTAAWELTAMDRMPARLLRSTLCTPEGSAARRMCGATYELVLKP